MNSSFKNNQEAYSRMKNFILRSFPLSTQLTQSYERKKRNKKKTNKQMTTAKCLTIYRVFGHHERRIYIYFKLVVRFSYLFSVFIFV